jgi:hypothetical protein
MSLKYPPTVLIVTYFNQCRISQDTAKSRVLIRAHASDNVAKIIREQCSTRTKIKHTGPLGCLRVIHGMPGLSSEQAGSAHIVERGGLYFRKTHTVFVAKAWMQNAPWMHKPPTMNWTKFRQAIRHLNEILSSDEQLTGALVVDMLKLKRL